jgi:hypothetical protein
MSSWDRLWPAIAKGRLLIHACYPTKSHARSALATLRDLLNANSWRWMQFLSVVGAFTSPCIPIFLHYWYIYMFTVHISSCIYRMYTHTHAFPRLFLLIGCFMIVRPHGTCHEGRPLIPKWVFQAVLSSFICPWIPWFFLAPLVGNSMS